MLLSSALQRFFTLRPEQLKTDPTRAQLSPRAARNLEILELFDDDKRNSIKHAFSIQNIVEVGLQEHGRLPGEWYGVCTMNEIFRALNESYNFDPKLSENSLGRFKICEFKNGEIVTKQVLQAALGSQYSQAPKEVKEESKENKESGDLSKSEEAKLPVDNEESDSYFERARAQRLDSLGTLNSAADFQFGEEEASEEDLRQNFSNSILILVSIQLGLGKIPEEYHDAVHRCMRIKQFVGAVGGRPGFAHYIVGPQFAANPTEGQSSNRGLVYLDPHYVQTKVRDVAKEYAESPQKFHCGQARVIGLEELDPSLSFGFLV
mmetsp:Transcript_17511/g.29500  ORF Transcript_17511/g.29500 Transcript_17511/m.29500 type:complete len:320 (-) Transcript_17511:237-1196(-)